MTWACLLLHVIEFLRGGGAEAGVESEFVYNHERYILSVMMLRA